MGLRLAFWSWPRLGPGARARLFADDKVVGGRAAPAMTQGKGPCACSFLAENPTAIWRVPLGCSISTANAAGPSGITRYVSMRNGDCAGGQSELPADHVGAGGVMQVLPRALHACHRAALASPAAGSSPQLGELLGEERLVRVIARSSQLSTRRAASH